MALINSDIDKKNLFINILVIFTVGFTIVIGFILGLIYPGLVFGDLFLYNAWYQMALEGNIYGVNVEWVYPYLALLPMFLAGIIAPSFSSFFIAWLILNLLLYIVAFLMFKNSFSNFKFTPYILFLFSSLMLFTLFMQRLDGIAIALTIIGLSLYKYNKWWIVIFLAVAMWIKIWPVAFLIALFFISSERFKLTLKIIFINSIIIFLPLFFGGSLKYIFGFMGMQGGRGLQVESVYALPWAAGLGGVFANREIGTWEVTGAGSEVVADVANVLLLVALGLMIVLGFVFKERFVGDFEFLVLFGSVLVAVLIVFNKVGSPQFAGWLLVPLLFLSQFGFARFKVLIGFALLGVVGTGLSAPVFYGAVLGQEWLGFVVLFLKWVGIVGFMTVGIVTLFRMFRSKQESLVNTV